MNYWIWYLGRTRRIWYRCDGRSFSTLKAARASARAMFNAPDGPAGVRIQDENGEVRAFWGELWR